VIGFSPQQVNEMSLWQYMAAVEGYVKIKSPDKGELTTAEKDELWDWLSSS